jgi:hypothetical protein
MGHSDGTEYQLKIVHDNGTEELSRWMNSEEQVAAAMAACHRLQGDAYWLRERNVGYPNCLDSEQTILEFRLTYIPSPRYSPHDSHYLLAVGSRNQCELPEVVTRNAHY